MYTCHISLYLAYAMAIYCIASLYYFIVTRSIGTPFNDSLTKEQQEIKKKSSTQRANIFCIGIAIGLGTIIVWRPFQKCVK